MKYEPKDLALKNGQTVTIRSIAEADAEEMIRFMNQVDSESRFLGREPGEFAYTLEAERELIKARGEDARSLWLVVETNGRILANCQIAGVHTRKRFRHRAGIGIAVCREYWSMGIGRAIMSECIGAARQAGYEQVELDVVAGNVKALGLYKSLGFEIAGTKRNAMKYADGSYADEHFMILSL